MLLCPFAGSVALAFLHILPAFLNPWVALPVLHRFGPLSVQDVLQSCAQEEGYKGFLRLTFKSVNSSTNPAAGAAEAKDGDSGTGASESKADDVAGVFESIGLPQWNTLDVQLDMLNAPVPRKLAELEEKLTKPDVVHSFHICWRTQLPGSVGASASVSAAVTQDSDQRSRQPQPETTVTTAELRLSKVFKSTGSVTLKIPTQLRQTWKPVDVSDVVADAAQMPSVGREDGTSVLFDSVTVSAEGTGRNATLSVRCVNDDGNLAFNVILDPLAVTLAPGAQHRFEAACRRTQRTGGPPVPISYLRGYVLSWKLEPLAESTSTPACWHWAEFVATNIIIGPGTREPVRGAFFTVVAVRKQ